MITKGGVLWLLTLLPDSGQRVGRFWTGVGLSYVSIYAIPFISWYDWRTASGWRLFDDSYEWQQMDKLGHIWTTYHLSWAYHDWALYNGYSERQSRWLAALLALGFQTSIEIVDGFFPKWGASLWDGAANAIGAGLFLLNRQSAPWQVEVRFSFFPSPYARQRPEVLGRGIAQILKDYNGQTYWLVFLHERLPVGLAVGHGARGMIGGYGREPRFLIESREWRRWLLSLDPNWKYLLRRPRWAIRIFVAIKTPLPTLVYERSALRVAWVYF